MLSFSFIPLVFVGVVLAQTPPGFSPNATAHLDIKFGTNTIDPPGKSLTKAQTANKPTLATSDPSLNGTYIWIMLDPDVPGSLVGGAAGTRVVYLHTLLKDYKPASTPVDGLYTLTSTATTPKTWTAPAPPAENPPYPHRYVNYLYTQPRDFSVPASQQSAVSSGLRFNITQFAIDAHLGDPVLGNYFQVTG